MEVDGERIGLEAARTQDSDASSQLAEAEFFRFLSAVCQIVWGRAQGQFALDNMVAGYLKALGL